MIDRSGSSLLLQPSRTKVVTTTAQMCPGRLTCMHKHCRSSCLHRLQPFLLFLHPCKHAWCPYPGIATQALRSRHLCIAWRLALADAWPVFSFLSSDAFWNLMGTAQMIASSTTQIAAQADKHVHLCNACQLHKSQCPLMGLSLSRILKRYAGNHWVMPCTTGLSRLNINIMHDNCSDALEAYMMLADQLQDS